MNRSNDKIKMALPYICTLLLVAGMVLLSELLNEKEIIFPEITALAVGYMVAKKRSWKVNGRRMILLITLCAVLGVMIVRYMGSDPFVEMIIAFAFAQVLFMYSGTTFAPFVSAIVLPVMMRTTSWVYPATALGFTVIVVAFHKLFLNMGIRHDEEYTPVLLNSRDDIFDTVLRVICVAIIGFAAFSLNLKYIIAPPLLVAFTEFSRPRNKTRNKPVKTIAVFTGCAIFSAICRYIIVIKLGLPLTLAAFLAVAFMLILLCKMKMFMPPVGAIVMLCMIIPGEMVISYPIQIFVGSTIIMIISRLLFMKRQDKKLYIDEHELKTE